MASDLTNRYAMSMYVDLRLGIIGGRVYSIEDARDLVAASYGRDAANRAERLAD